MNIETGKPDHIEDYLAQLHTGQWFGWSDSKNKIYANLIIHDDSKTKPTEQECNDGLAKLQGEYSKGYVSLRKNAYPEIGDQLDMLWHTMDKDNELQHKFYDFYQTIKKVKVTYPKN
tara:strand:- start:478 stop:828 length:351 start_codon:yes stop_codon:yes gene_type:complete